MSNHIDDTTIYVPTCVHTCSNTGFPQGAHSNHRPLGGGLVLDHHMTKHARLHKLRGSCDLDPSVGVCHLGHVAAIVVGRGSMRRQSGERLRECTSRQQGLKTLRLKRHGLACLLVNPLVTVPNNMLVVHGILLERIEILPGAKRAAYKQNYEHL